MKKNSFLFVSILTLSISLFAYSIWTTYPIFQDKRLLDSLALIHSLPITYYLSAVLILAVSIGTLLHSLNNKYIHLVLLVTFAVVLWMTPYLLTGFVRLPLGPWKIAQSVHIEEILHGIDIPLSWYGKNYPGSFVFNDIFLTVSGVGAIEYIRLVFPLFQLVFMVLSIYVFLTRLFGQRIAFLAGLLIIPGLHYVVLQPGPSSSGVVLLFSLLILLTGGQLKRKVLFSLAFFVLVITHSVYSLLLLVLMFGAFFVQRIFGKFKIDVDSKLLLISSIWFLTWETAYVAQDKSIVFRLGFVGSFDFWQRMLSGSQIASLGGTLFSSINLLGRATYLAYLLVTVMTVGGIYWARKALKEYPTLLSERRTPLRLTSLEIWLFAEVLLTGIMGLAMLVRTPDEAERILLIFILCCSSIAAYGILDPYKGLTKGLKIGKYARRLIVMVLGGGLMLLVLVYPFVAYSIDSYSNYPFSEHLGLEFSSKTVDSSMRIFIVSSESQYLFYRTDFKITSSDSFSAANGSDALNSIMTRDLASTDAVVLRSTAYFFFSIRVDHSFESNRYLLLKQRLEVSGFNLVYSNPSYEMWVKVRRYGGQ